LSLHWLVFADLLERPPTADVKVVLHLFLLMEPEYAIVPVDAAVAAEPLESLSLTNYRIYS
jgi:hypothetical protein